tara:strand:- start:515 stop:688 length:174 start_codon:yes stop_codon:yes gene_type:complete
LLCEESGATPTVGRDGELVNALILNLSGLITSFCRGIIHCITKKVNIFSKFKPQGKL